MTNNRLVTLIGLLSVLIPTLAYVLLSNIPDGLLFIIWCLGLPAGFFGARFGQNLILLHHDQKILDQRKVRYSSAILFLPLRIYIALSVLLLLFLAVVSMLLSFASTLISGLIGASFTPGWAGFISWVMGATLGCMYGILRAKGEDELLTRVGISFVSVRAQSVADLGEKVEGFFGLKWL